MDDVKFDKPPRKNPQRFGRTSRALFLAMCWQALPSAALAQTAGLDEGDTWHKADVARATFKKADGSAVDGAGVKVCVMSDSIDNGQGALAAARLSKDIPAEPQLKSIDGQEGQGNGEGLAMLEIVHKMAPSANLGFATGNVQPSQQVLNIQALIDANCKIIVDDITNPLDAPFQDGTIAKLYNAATANKGVLFIASAGNTGNRKYNNSGVWEGNFVDGGGAPAFGIGRINKFPSGTIAATLTAKTQQIWLYWSDPWDHPTNSYTLWVYIKRSNQFLPNGFQVHVANAPAEYLDATNIRGLECGGSTDPKDRCFDVGDYILVTKDDAPGTSQPSQPRFLRLDVGEGKLDVGTNGQISGRGGSENVLAVGAVASKGVFTGASVMGAGSADGPRRKFYNEGNTPIFTSDGSGRVVKKPDLAAANDVKTTLPPSLLNPFQGTSAAAPHVAGIAALILSYRPTLTPAQVGDILVGSAIDIESPGWDDVSGYGIPMADRALAIADDVVQPVDTTFNGKLENDTSWGGEAFAMAVQPDGKIVVGGGFGNKPTVQRLKADGSSDPNFHGATLPVGPGREPRQGATIYALALQSDGKIVMGGNDGVARLKDDGSLDPSFSQPQGVWSGARAMALAIQNDGKVLVGGAWGFARLKGDGSIDRDFKAAPDGTVRSLALQPDGKILIGGDFTHVNGQPRSQIARLNADGSLDTSFNFTAPAPPITALAVLGDGKVLAGGPGFMARLGANGTPDPAFNAEPINSNGGAVQALALLPGGKVLIGGDFLIVNGNGKLVRFGIARLHADGSLDRSFEAAPKGDGYVHAMVLQPSSKLLVAGKFKKVNDQANLDIARLKIP